MWPFDQNNQPMYQQYAQAYDTGNYGAIDPYQAMRHMQQFMQNAPPPMQQQVYQQYFQQMPYEQRMQFAQQMPPQYAMNPNDPYSMAQGFHQIGQQQPNMLQQLFGQGGSFGNPMAQGGISSLVGLVARHLMSNQGGGNMFGASQPYGYSGGQQYGYSGGGWEGEREGYQRREREEEREGYQRREREEERRDDF